LFAHLIIVLAALRAESMGPPIGDPLGRRSLGERIEPLNLRVKIALWKHPHLSVTPGSTDLYLEVYLMKPCNLHNLLFQGDP
jgi:hypothetical protein